MGSRHPARELGRFVAAIGKVVELGGREMHTTNNRMELMAAAARLPARQAAPPARALVRTDSAMCKRITSGCTAGKRTAETQSKKDVLTRSCVSHL